MEIHSNSPKLYYGFNATWSTPIWSTPIWSTTHLVYHSGPETPTMQKRGTSMIYSELIPIPKLNPTLIPNPNPNPRP